MCHQCISAFLVAQHLSHVLTREPGLTFTIYHNSDFTELLIFEFLNFLLHSRNTFLPFYFFTFNLELEPWPGVFVRCISNCTTNEVQGERRAKLVCAMLSRSLHSLLQLVCESKIKHKKKMYEETTYTSKGFPKGSKGIPKP